MIGNVALFVRIGLYLVAGEVADLGDFARWAADTGTLTIDVGDLAQFVAGLVMAAGTFAWSRVAKHRGGVT